MLINNWYSISLTVPFRIYIKNTKGKEWISLNVIEYRFSIRKIEQLRKSFIAILFGFFLWDLKLRKLLNRTSIRLSENDYRCTLQHSDQEDKCTFLRHAFFTHSNGEEVHTPRGCKLFQLCIPLFWVNCNDFWDINIMYLFTLNYKHHGV